MFNLLKLFATEEETTHWADRYRAGGMGYGEVKKRLAEVINERFAQAREIRATWAADPVKLAEVRQAGAERAQKTARIVLDRARAACGLC